MLEFWFVVHPFTNGYVGVVGHNLCLVVCSKNLLFPKLEFC